jgi:hypothetical protein
MARKTSDRKIPTVIYLTSKIYDALDAYLAVNGGSTSEFVRNTVEEKLTELGFMKEDKAPSQEV